MRTPPPRRKLIRTVMIAVAAVAAAVGIALLVVYVLLPWLRGDDTAPERPSITAIVDGTSIEVKPFEYCEVKRPDICDPPGETAQLPVAADEQIEIELPESISSAPWILATFYVDPSASEESEEPAEPGEPGESENLQSSEQFFAPNDKSAVSVPGSDDQGRELAGVEVRLPTGLFDTTTGEDTIVTHATWSIATR